jgi:hypothetical protein
MSLQDQAVARLRLSSAASLLLRLFASLRETNEAENYKLETQNWNQKNSELRTLNLELPQARENIEIRSQETSYSGLPFA